MTKSDLHLLFAPRSIAVAGASNKTGKMGNLFMQRLTADFRGTLYAINPTEREVGGVTTVKSIAEVLHPIDLLIALVPAARLIERILPPWTGSLSARDSERLCRITGARAAGTSRERRPVTRHSDSGA
jgi:3-hydroxyisobutyrate dehydrogenase-like beta-hydroxyacid dehydrogenase